MACGALGCRCWRAILRELFEANESESNACVVILSEEDKETMDDYLRAVGQEFDGSMYPLLTESFGNPLALDDKTFSGRSGLFAGGAQRTAAAI